MASELYVRLESDLGSRIVSWGLAERDPPDVTALLADGRRLGIEVTELVNQRAIESQIRGLPRYQQDVIRFGTSRAVVELRRILAEKERKLAAVRGDYDGLALLVHTDEPMLKSDNFRPVAAEFACEVTEIFAWMYLVFSYEPQHQGCPAVRLL